MTQVNMKIAYLDCFSGVSGDMFVGSLLDAGLSFEKLERDISGLNLDGYRISAKKWSRLLRNCRVLHG